MAKRKARTRRSSASVASRKARASRKTRGRRNQARKRQAKRSPRAKAMRKAAARTAIRSRPRTKARTAPRRAKRPPQVARKARAAAPVKTPRLNRDRRLLPDDIVQSPPSSLDMDRRGSAVRTGRAEIEESRRLHGAMTPAITGGDVDASVENAYFSGEEAPGGDNPTPDQDVVDEIGRAIGIEYQDNEELRGSDKVVERDRHRWELDPASAEDYKERK